MGLQKWPETHNDSLLEVVLCIFAVAILLTLKLYIDLLQYRNMT